MLKSMRKSKNRYFYHIFVSPGDAPAIITHYVAWMVRQFNACQTPSSMYPSIFNSFPVIRTANAKKSPFSRTAAHIFVSPGDAPATITMLKSMHKSKNRYFYHILVSPGDASGAITLNVVWMEREFDAYKLSRSMYPSIFNSFPAIRTASAKSPFSRTAAHIFVSPGDSPATITQYVA